MNTESKPLVVLIDDSEAWRGSAKDIIRELGRRPVKTSGDPYRTREILNTLRGPAIFLVDYNMPPHKRGTEVIRDLYKHAQFPIVCGLLTAETSLAVKTEALDVDADPLPKAPTEQDGVTLGQYLMSVIGFLERKLEERVKLHTSKFDKLTGAYNWEGGQEVCLEVLRESKKRHLSAALIYLDGNNFKSINDRFGHDAGNEVIKVEVAEVSAEVRIKPKPDHPKIHDAVFRMGDEICILLSEISEDEVHIILAIVEKIARRIQKRLHNQTVDMGGGMRVVPYVSCGVAALSYKDMKDPVTDLKRLLGESEASMYRDKIRVYEELSAQGVEWAKEKLEHHLKHRPEEEDEVT